MTKLDYERKPPGHGRPSVGRYVAIVALLVIAFSTCVALVGFFGSDPMTVIALIHAAWLLLLPIGMGALIGA